MFSGAAQTQGLACALSLATILCLVTDACAADAGAANTGRCFYIDVASESPRFPHNAATNAARDPYRVLNEARRGDHVVIAPGTYALRYCLQIPEGVTVEGADPSLVILDAGNRCRVADLAAGAVLRGVTVVNGSAAQIAGGVLADNTALIDRCIITRNFARQYGGGIVGGMVRNSLIIRNGGGELYGGGVVSADVQNCTMVENQTEGLAGGAYACTVWNSILVNNAPDNEHQCSTNSIFSVNVWDEVPLGAIFMNNALADYRLIYRSPAIDAGKSISWMDHGKDLAGGARVFGRAPDLGCFEYSGRGPIRISLASDETNICVGFTVTLRAVLSGEVQGLEWTCGDENDLGSDMTLNHVFEKPGDWPVTIRVWNSDGSASATATINVSPMITNHVSMNGSNVPPFMTEGTAARSIQDAVNMCRPGGLVLVHDGIYESSVVAATHGEPQNGITVDKRIFIKSVHGPTTTTIRGGKGIRCMYLANGAHLSGVTLSGGDLRGNRMVTVGGGVLCGNDATVENCIVENNVADQAGGVYGGTLINCTLQNNTAVGDVGGGATLANLEQCTVVNNQSRKRGGGVGNCQLHNSVVISNTPDNAYSCTGDAQDY